MSYVVETSIEIAAPPEAVRAKMTDLANIPKWSPAGYIKSISPIAPATTLDLKLNQKIQVDMQMASFSPVVVTNEPQEFAWIGSIPYIFTGKHCFKFEPGSKPGHTKFTQAEYFTGALAWTMGENWLAQAVGAREGTKVKWNAFNEDLKAEMERK